MRFVQSVTAQYPSAAGSSLWADSQRASVRATVRSHLLFGDDGCLRSKAERGCQPLRWFLRFSLPANRPQAAPWRTLMANPSDVSSPPVPDVKREAGECPPDNKLPENSQDNLDVRLDHAVGETFPTSDPVSVHITAGPKPDRPAQEAPSSLADDHLDQPGQDSTEH